MGLRGNSSDILFPRSMLWKIFMLHEELRRKETWKSRLHWTGSYPSSRSYFCCWILDNWSFELQLPGIQSSQPKWSKSWISQNARPQGDIVFSQNYYLSDSYLKLYALLSNFLGICKFIGDCWVCYGTYYWGGWKCHFHCEGKVE